MNTVMLSVGISILLTFGFVSCTDGAPATDKDHSNSAALTTATGPTDSTSRRAGTMSQPDSIATMQEYTFHGTVKKIDRERRLIVLDHEKIDGYMEAMTMPYAVSDPALLDRVQVGDAAQFTIRVTGGKAMITTIHDNGGSAQDR